MTDYLQDNENIRLEHLDSRTAIELKQILRPFQKTFYKEKDNHTFTHEI